MVSSAVYRYFPSRDHLLTALIVDAYDSLGAAVEAAVAGLPAANYERRWLTVCRGVRAWAIDHPHEYALIYGSPVPGYRAPEDTIGPAARVALVLVQLLIDATAAGVIDPTELHGPLPRPVRADLARLHDTFVGVEDAVIVRGTRGVERPVRPRVLRAVRPVPQRDRGERRVLRRRRTRARRLRRPPRHAAQLINARPPHPRARWRAPRRTPPPPRRARRDGSPRGAPAAQSRG